MVHDLIKTDYLLEPGHLFVALEPSLIRCVLGTCVSVAIWDRRLAIGGMSHFITPSTRDQSKATARYGNVSTLALVKILERHGSRRCDMEAQILGGGTPPDGKSKLGEQNVKAARKTLKQCGVKIVSEDIGGTRGRKIVFDTRTGHTAVMKVHTIRHGDWYPLDLRYQRTLR